MRRFLFNEFALEHITNSLGSGWHGLSGSQVFGCHHCGFTIVLGEHVLTLFTLAMTTISNNGQTHCLVLLVTGHQLLETLGQVLELSFAGKARLEQLGLHLNLILVVLQWRTLEVSHVLLWRNSRVCRVMVDATESIKSTSCIEVASVLLLLRIVVVNRHHVLQIVALR